MRRMTFVVLVLTQVLAALISVSVFFAEETEKFASDANVLISTFGVGMALFGILLTFLADKGERRAWTVLWYWPIFFILHVAAFQTYVPDLVLAIIWVGGLVIMRPAQQRTTGAA